MLAAKQRHRFVRPNTCRRSIRSTPPRTRRRPLSSTLQAPGSSEKPPGEADQGRWWEWRRPRSEPTRPTAIWSAGRSRFSRANFLLVTPRQRSKAHFRTRATSLWNLESVISDLFAVEMASRASARSRGYTAPSLLPIERSKRSSHEAASSRFIEGAVLGRTPSAPSTFG